jgi:hypothetical protein
MPKAAWTRIEIAQSSHDFVGSDAARQCLENPRVRAELIPLPMRQQITQGHFTCHPRVAELKPGQVLDDRIVPEHFPFVHQQRNGSRGEGLAERCERKDCALVYACVFADLPKPYPLRKTILSSLTTPIANPGTRHSAMDFRT